MKRSSPVLPKTAMRCGVVLLGLILTATAVMAQAGTKIEEGFLDMIELHADAPAGSQGVVIKLFDTSGADLGTGSKGGKKKPVEVANQMKKDAPGILADAFVTRTKELGTFSSASKGPGSGLVVEGRFTMLDPGSRAKRYWAGFGAGKGSVEVEGTVKSASGKVIAKFRQKRLTVMGVGGGDSLKKMTKDSKNLGQDIAEFLDAWVKGKNLR